MIKKIPRGWLVDIRPTGGYGKRYRKTFETKLDAEKWKAWITTKLAKEPEWNPKPIRETRHLSDLIKTWHTLHGIHLKDAENRVAILQQFANDIRNPLANEFTAQHFTNYRQQKLEQGLKPSTLNHLHAYLRALFNELERLGEWTGGNPLGKLRQLKHAETELAFLTREQITALLAATRESRNEDCYPVTLICLATGARWSEAEELTRSRVSTLPPRITFGDTKSGKVRSVPIDPHLASALAHRHADTTGRIFKPCYAAFGKALERAGIELPEGQRSHVLRHTFASHFMQGGGSILSLQRILGHQSLTMTMRYAHLAPEHLAEAVNLNPLARFGHSLDTSFAQTENEAC